MKNLYSILGVKKNATSETIKKAHRRLVKKHHPDKNGGDPSQEFLDIQKAYEILSTPQMRAMYDEHGFTEADNQYAQLAQLAAGLIQHCIKIGISPGQLMNEAEKQLLHSIEKLKEKKEAIEDEIDKLKAQKSALKTKKKLKVDMFGQIIMEMMRQKESERLKLSRVIENHEALIDVIGKYEKGDIPMPVVNFGLSFPTTMNYWGSGAI